MKNIHVAIYNSNGVTCPKDKENPPKLLNEIHFAILLLAEVSGSRGSRRSIHGIPFLQLLGRLVAASL